MKTTTGKSIPIPEEARKALKEEKWPEAASLLCGYLDENLEDPETLFLLQYAFLMADSPGLSYNVGKRAIEAAPDNAAAYHNLGKLFHEMQKDNEADEYFRKAIRAKMNFPASLEGLGMSALHRADWQECISYSNRALAEDPNALDARVNRGMAYLALKRWREGWRDFDANSGVNKNRKELSYADTPKWDGAKGQNVVVYGEQGIGDEISFASCLPDLIRDSKSVTIECDKRLVRLFNRSFQGCEVHGSRYKEARPLEKRAFDAKVLMGALPGFYRLKDADFPGTPYLTPNPQMATAWEALLASLGPKPRIGISWIGGIPKTGQKRRSVTLDTYAPLFKGIDAHWVSLQYKEYEGIEAAEEKYGIKIHDWDWGNRYYDYDQTVALISRLDLVISVCTTAVHAAGSIGKECWCLVPEGPLWRYLAEGSWFPWAKSVELFRQKGREWPIYSLLGKLKDRYPDFVRNGHQQGEAQQKAA